MQPWTEILEQRYLQYSNIYFFDTLDFNSEDILLFLRQIGKDGIIITKLPAFTVYSLYQNIFRVICYSMTISISIFHKFFYFLHFLFLIIRTPSKRVNLMQISSFILKLQYSRHEIDLVDLKHTVAVILKFLYWDINVYVQ